MSQSSPHVRKIVVILFLLVSGCLPAVTSASPTPTQVTSQATPSLTATIPATATPTPTEVVPTPHLLSFAGDIPHHRMDVRLDDLNRRLEVRHRVVFKNQSADPWTEVVFSVPSAHQPGVFQLEMVGVTTTRRMYRADFELDGIMLYVVLPEPIPPREPLAVTLDYVLEVPQVELTTWLPEGNLGAGDRIIQAGDWHPSLVPYADGKGWHVWTYHPVGDTTVYPIANYDVRIFADPEVIIAAAGEVPTQDGGARYHLERARTFAFLASRDYMIREDSVLGLPIRAYFLPEHAPAAETALATAKQAIELYTKIYGPYPYPKLGLVLAQNAYYGAMEYSGLVTLSGYAYQTYAEGASSFLTDLTAHEVAHQWWYGAVGNDQVHAPWLDESFARYSELLFIERYEPDRASRWWHNNVDRFDPVGPLDRTVYEFATSAELIQQIYGQGAHFLHDLRDLMGDEAFFEFVKAYQREGNGRLVTQDDFFQTLDAHTDADIEPLIDRYFRSPEE